MGGVDLLDQRVVAYRFDRKSTGRYYLRIFFDLWGTLVVNAYIAYCEIKPIDLELLNFKLVIARDLIGAYNSRQKNVPAWRPTKRSS